MIFIGSVVLRMCYITAVIVFKAIDLCLLFRTLNFVTIITGHPLFRYTKPNTAIAPPYTPTFESAQETIYIWAKKWSPLTIQRWGSCFSGS